MGRLGRDIDRKDDFHIPGMVHKLLGGCGLMPFLGVLGIVDMGLGIDRHDDFHILDVAYKVRIGRALKRLRVVLDIVDLGLDLEAIYVC
jgi:hypothetical protein